MTGKAKTYRAEAAIELSSPLFLGPEFSGLLKSATIGGVDVQIVLPSFKRDIVEVGTVLHPRARFDWLDFFGQQDTKGRSGLAFRRGEPLGEGRPWGDRGVLGTSAARDAQAA